MVLESLISPLKAERKPWETFFVGIVYSSFAMLISFFIFKEFSSAIMVSLTAMVCVPLIYGAIKLEEKKDLEISEEKILIKEHGKVLSFFVFLFLGFVVSFVFWHIVLPADTVEILFRMQLNTIEEINSPVTGSLINTSSSLGIILLNNLKVLVFCLLFSFFYGFGSIFILTWNASVIAAVIGTAVMEHGSHFIAPLVLLKYSLHGIPEILAYFMVGLAGGIISIAVVRHDYGSGEFKHIMVDSLDLIIAAVVILGIAALIEVFISPMIL